jgi:hypothetical protein
LLKEVLGLFNGYNQEQFLVGIWLGKPDNNLDLNSLKEVLGLFDDGSQKRFPIEIWLKKEQNPKLKFENFCKLVKEDFFGSMYDCGAITEAYGEVTLPISSLPDLCQQLYPNNEFCRQELFKEFINSGKLQDEEGKSLLKAFVISLQENDHALEIITISSTKNALRLSELEILELTSNRLSKKYESVKEVLGAKELMSSLTEEGKKTVKNLFENAELSTKNLADLFSYYDIKNQIIEFKSVVTPEILQEIVQAYVPSTKSPYLAREEYQKLQTLFNNEDRPNPNLNLPLVSVLTTYLKSKIVIPQVNPDQFQFAKSELLENVILKESVPKEAKEEELRDLTNKTRLKITENFKKLLTTESEDLQSEDVVTFFEEALALESKINAENSKKLLDFFKDNRSQLAVLFQQENGLDKFAAAIGSLGDGCVANIATQAKIALYQSLITDPCDHALFSVFQEKISTAILNSGGDNLGGSANGADIFDDNTINDSLISPNGLIEALKEEFFKDGKKVRDSWDLIGSKVTEEKKQTLSEMLLEKDPNNFEKNAAQIAAYIILQNTVPEFLEERYVQKFKDDCREIIDEVNQEVENQQEPVPVVSIASCSPLRAMIRSLFQSFRS